MSRYPNLPPHGREAITIMERRKQHLDKRISQSSKDLSFDKAERGAIAFLLRYVEQHERAKE